MADKLVYSTGGEAQAKNTPDAKSSSYQKSPGPCKMRLETAGRGGKSVTVLFNLPFEEAEARAIMKELQTKLGCGATMKGSHLEFRGDLREKIEKFLGTKGVKVIRAGG